jgi:hypothetical protein
MKHPLILITATLMLLCSCKSEKRIATYEDLYKEQPFVIMLAPPQDKAQRLLPKTTQDQVLNDEMTIAAQFVRQTAAKPLADQGYYVLAPLVTDVLIDTIKMDYHQLANSDIKPLSAQFGIDAVLLIAIHKWQEPEMNEVAVYAEYTLRSTKTGMELMHSWVRGSKMQPLDAKGVPMELSTDMDFINRTGFSNRLAHRCLLLEAMSDFVLRSLPTSAGRWYFQHDQYVPANPNYYSFTIFPDGSIERSNLTEESFGNEGFQN